MVREFASKIFGKGKQEALLRVGGTAASVAAAGAAALSNVAMAVDGASAVGGILDAVSKIFPWIGAFFILSGGVKLLLAYRNDQPEAQAGAAKDIVIGIAFVVFDILLLPALKSAAGI